MSIPKILKEIEAIKKMVLVDDLINAEDAAKFLGITKKTIQNYSTPHGKLLGTYIINPLGHKMYFKSKLAGLQ